MWLVGALAMPCAVVGAEGLAWGWRRGRLGGTCSPPPDLSHLGEWSRLPHWRSRYLDLQSKLETSDIFSRTPSPHILPAFCLPEDQGQPCPLAMPPLSLGADMQCAARAIPLSPLTHATVVCTDAVSPHFFVSLPWLLHGPNCKLRLQRALFVPSPCGASYFLLALRSTCNFKIYLFTISAAEMVVIQVFSLKPASSPGSFCCLPNLFCFDNLFLTLCNLCENCKYSRNIPSSVLLWCLLTLSLLFHAAI